MSWSYAVVLMILRTIKELLLDLVYKTFLYIALILNF